MSLENAGAVRVKTIEERILDLANPELCKDGTEAEKIIKMLNNERAQITETSIRYTEELEREISQLKTEIKALVFYIQLKDI